MLLSEEMMRTLRFFLFKASDWERRADPISWPTPSTYSLQPEGRIAYAKKQANMYLRMAEHCKLLWADSPSHVARMLAIIENPSLALPEDFADDTAQSQSKYNMFRR